ncbi:MAG: VWA domain-containing protein [Gemmataceae bacterium]
MRALLPPRTWLFVLVSLALGLALPRAADGDDRKKDAKTGIQLVGRSDKDPPPGAWRVFDDAKKRVSEIFNDWGFVPLKPGKYQILIAPRSGSGDVPWGEVTVAAGETATVRVDSGIQLAGRSDKDRPPRAWRIYDGPKNRLTETFNAWGFVPLRPGKYRIMLEPWFSSVDMLWTEVTVEAGKTAAVKLDSGVELVPPARKPSGVHWYFRRAGKKELIARIAGDWGFLLLPPGNYEVETEVRDAVSRFSLSVPPGSVTPLTLKDAGLAELQIELPAAQDVVLATGSSEMKLEATVAPGKKSKERSFQRVSLPDGPATKRLTTWIVHMPKAAARLTSGKLTLECELEALPFEGAKLTFDAAELAARQGLTLFHADFSKAEAGKKQQILVSDGADSSLLRLEQDPPAKRRYLSFGGAGVRLRAGDQEIVRRDLPPGKETAVVFEPTTTMATTAPKIHVDIAIESPAEGTIVKEKKVKLIGRASTTGPAGATRVAIVIDVSGSTTDPSGSADPAINTILKAETAAARLLIDELERIDAKAPGTAFEVALLTFSSDAQILRPLTKMTDPAGVQKLRDALDTLAKTPPKGDTDYPAAAEARRRRSAPPSGAAPRSSSSSRTAPRRPAVRTSSLPALTPPSSSASRASSCTPSAWAPTSLARSMRKPPSRPTRAAAPTSSPPWPPPPRPAARSRRCRAPPTSSASSSGCPSSSSPRRS